MSAFAIDPPELTFNKADLRSGARKLVRCRSDLPIDWQHVQVEADESYVVVESLHVDTQAGELTFSVGCRPTHQGDHRRTAIRVAGSTSNAVETGQKPYVAMLPIFSHDFAALRVAPHVPVFEPAAQGPGWSGYLILTGDLIEQGIRPKTISAHGCRVTFEMLALGPAAQRVNITLEGPLDRSPSEPQKLQLTFDNGLRQSLSFRLEPH
jgi:hypothetical protein